MLKTLMKIPRLMSITNTMTKRTKNGVTLVEVDSHEVPYRFRADVKPLFLPIPG